jgi:hypothetical protein
MFRFFSQISNQIGLFLPWKERGQKPHNSRMCHLLLILTEPVTTQGLFMIPSPTDVQVTMRLLFFF